jgi:UDP-glucose 4-epimerase
MKAIVTGGAGFVGSHVVDELMKNPETERVLVIDDMRLGNELNIAHHGKDIDLWSMSVQDAFAEQLGTIHAFDADVVYNMAVDPLPKSLIYPWEVWENNVDITKRVAKFCGDYEIRMVHFSSSEVYGTIPTGKITERNAMNPLTMYAASKAAGDHIISALVETENLDAVTIRPFNCIGPRQNEKSYAGIIPMTINKIKTGQRPMIYGTGQQTRDYTYVTDIAKAATLVAAHGDAGEVYNACSGEETRIDWLVNEISFNMNYTGKVDYGIARVGDVMRHQGDNSKIKELGWAPTVGIREAVKRTVEWYNVV